MNRHRRIPAIVVRKVAGDQMHLIEIDGDEVRDTKTGALAPVFRDGVMTSKTTLAEVRARLGALA